MQLSQKIRIYPTKEQLKVLWDLSEKCRLIYNFALSDRIDNWKEQNEVSEEDRKYITYTTQQNELPEIKHKYPEYKWVYSKVLQMTLRNLDASYKSFFALWKSGDKNARPPRFKGKQYFTTLCYNQSGFDIENDIISFSHKHPSKTEISFDISHYPLKEETKKIKQVEIFTKKGKWFVSITYEFQEPKYIDNGKYQAIDLGVSNIISAVNLDGKFIQIKSRRVDLYWKNKLQEVQSKRDHCKKYSRRWKKYHLKFCRMKSKCANQLKDFQHKISKQIVENTKANTIIVGDLNVKSMAKKKKTTKSPRKNKANKTLNHSIQNTGSLGRFVQFLTYKARKIGKRVIRIDESYTTQTCAKCGVRVKRELSERDITCDCGHQMDRDLNSAVNIMIKFLMSDNLSHQPSLKEESFLRKWNGFSTTHSPKICSPAKA
ncbi:MAG: transposase [Promethearchaeota archaeon]|nr:MAG: transposase [Candidatus Lokiarchaeota archaeon]